MSRHRDNCPLDCKVYVGELGDNATRHELEEAFGNYGKLRNVWVATNPPGFAFVMFYDARDAKDAVNGLNGKVVCGKRVRVEFSTGKTRHDRDRYDRGSSGGRGNYRYNDRYNSGGYRGSQRGSSHRRDYNSRGDYGRDTRDSRDNRDSRDTRDNRDSRDSGQRRRRYSRSRSRSASPVRRSNGHRSEGHRDRGTGRSGSGRPRTPPSRSRSPLDNSR